MAKKGLFEAVRRTAGMLALVLAFGLTMTGCATTNKGGTPGLINQFSAGKVLTEGQTEVQVTQLFLDCFLRDLPSTKALSRMKT
jgi:hypothetical protein